ncbi:hypothetical protein A2419_02875 [Candidatus Adlerbacteria bacterium RIFOXYC1_FULL_48_26]|uniref:Uncharacterized protein n=1 Tax=Candidatus Adlerbacteria bacterium RIFOXYC1_FULL_48_26 TaxID=1797247 RepID=A0A1F4Y3Z1_9BACT|nr:MAG: hypothetical protein A2419_02875 [Candidatus Adlerbacteria bacterium RIFOXYC1_FULL_48_26]OGC95105.1 MAG: hypothetical protein A2590_01790 [Candidatus Adlerbacteria bacterium RIFOXYD1_FULL_48_8]
MKKLILLAVALAVLVGGYVIYINYRSVPTDVPQSGRSMDIESYVRSRISDLSPTKEQLGGTFYVTEIESHGGAGTVQYEDGHNAYTADFTYRITREGQPIVDSFVIRSN